MLVVLQVRRPLAPNASLCLDGLESSGGYLTDRHLRVLHYYFS